MVKYFTFVFDYSIIDYVWFNKEYSMKYVTVTIATLLIGSGNAMAQQGPSTEQVLGAAAGAAIGNSIGDGDGRKIATVLGAIIGYRNGEAILGKPERYFYEESYSDRRERFEYYCRKEVPVEYEYDRNLARSWVRGCTDKLNRKQRELERQAYLDGLNQ